MRRIAGLRDVVDQFDVFLVDQFGVLHDGAAAYPGAVDAVARIAAMGREIIVLTNSGKGPSENAERLAALGFPLQQFHAVISSGGVARQLVRSGALGRKLSRGTKVCVLGRRGESYAFSSPDFRLVEHPEDAAFLVFAGSNAPVTSADGYRSILAAASQAHVPAICVNPDITMIRAGQLVPGPGAIGRIYESLGGAVEYIGKLSTAFFCHALATAEISVSARVLMIGDSPEHDVAGAKAIDMSSLLVRTGIHADLSDRKLFNCASKVTSYPHFLRLPCDGDRT